MEKTITVKNPTGLHARPAAVFVKKAGEFPCDVFLVKDGKKVNAKSIMSVLTLGIKKDDQVTLAAAGGKEIEALQILAGLLESL